MKKVKEAEVERYTLTDDAYVLVEHNADSDTYFATVVVPEFDFSVPLYTFNDASVFLTRYNPDQKFRSFSDAVSYMESNETVQNELKSVVPGYTDYNDFVVPSGGSFPLYDMIRMKARLLTSRFSEKEMNSMLCAARTKAVELTDDVIVDCFHAGKKKIGHDNLTEYYRLVFLYTTFSDTLDEYAEKDIDNVLSLMFDRKISISTRKDKEKIYRKLMEALSVYDDLFSDETPAVNTVSWLKNVIYSIVRDCGAKK